MSDGDNSNSEALRKLDTLMQSIADVKGVPMAKVLRNAARDMTRAMFDITPTAKITKSEVWFIKNPKYGLPRWVNKVSYGQGGKKRKTPKYRKVNKGWAMSSWIGAMVKLGMKTKKASASTSRAASLATAMASINEVDTHPFVRVVDAVNYISKLDTRAGITSAGISRAQSKIEGELLKLAASVGRKRYEAQE